MHVLCVSEECAPARVQNLLQSRTSSASSLVRSVQSITRFSRKTFSLYAVCARRLSIQSIQYSSYPTFINHHISVFSSVKVPPRRERQKFRQLRFSHTFPFSNPRASIRPNFIWKKHLEERTSTKHTSINQSRVSYLECLQEE